MFGKGGFGRGRGGDQLPFERFLEIEGLGKAKCPDNDNNLNIQLLRWSMELQNFWKMSPYYYEPAKKVVKTDIERYLDREQRKKRPLEDYIFMDADHLPGELVKAGGARAAKNVRWDMEMDASKFDDVFKKVEEKAKGKQRELMMMRKADEEDKDEEDEQVKEDDDDEESDIDIDDYNRILLCDDDDDDYNDVEDDNDEGYY